MTNIKKTKIVVTLGPATETYESIKNLVLAGANMFRINTSHGQLSEHKEKIDIIRNLEKELHTFFPILIDLQGPKIRVGTLIEPINLSEGEDVLISPSKIQVDKNIIPVDYEGICRDVNKDDPILLDDGKIQLKVLEVADNKIMARVTNGGILNSRKGLNIPGETSSLDAVTAQDIECIKFAVEIDAAYVALSFVRKKDDILLAKKYIDDFGGHIPVIAKIEKPQAVDNLDEIVSVSEGLMVARGDLGIEISPERVPIVQKRIIDTATKKRKVVIVATQMLETMITQPIPTRAEASDIANAILDGADAIMLSGETSVGKFSKEAVAMMTSIAKNVENSPFVNYDLNLDISDDYKITSQAIVNSAIRLAKDVKAKMILAFTHFGYSPRLLSKLRPGVPVVTISDDINTCRRLSLYWGLHPVYKEWDSYLSHELLCKIDEYLKEYTDLKDDDRVIFTGAIPHLITGSTNFLRVHRIGASKPEI